MGQASAREVGVGSGVGVDAGCVGVAVGDASSVGVTLGVGEHVLVGSSGILASAGRGVLVGVGVRLAVLEDKQPVAN